MAKIIASVKQGGGSAPAKLQVKNASPSDSSQAIVPDAGFDGLSRVNISAIPGNYVGSGVPRRASSDLSGVIDASDAVVRVFAPNGYYSSIADKEVDISDYDTLAMKLLGTLTKWKNGVITDIPSDAFKGYTQLLEIDCPEVTSIGSLAFDGCTGLTAQGIKLPKLKNIASQAFGSCTGITSELQLNGIKELNGATFYNCTNVPEITLINMQETIKIGGSAFYGCASLVSVYISCATVPTLEGAYAFMGTPIDSGTGFIYVPDGLYEDFSHATNWSTLVIGGKVKKHSQYPA